MYDALLFNLIFASGHAFCWPCSRNVSALHEDGPLRAETCRNVTVNKVLLTYTSALVRSLCKTIWLTILKWNKTCTPSDSCVRAHILFHFNIILFYFILGACGGVVVKALRCKPAGRGFDSRWCQDFSPWHNSAGRTVALGSTQPLTEMSTRWVSRHQECSWG